jgi:UDP-N-acetylglucosamine:LPS N-acetylglucosamine transferase
VADMSREIALAKILENDNLDGMLLNRTINEIILNKESYKKMGQNATKISISNTKDRIYEQIFELVERK